MKADTATQTLSRKEKTSELSEDPIYALKHGVPINTDYYINKQIWPSVRSFQMLLLPSLSSTHMPALRAGMWVERKRRHKFKF